MSLKRPRDDFEAGDHDDSDVSITSRTPSPEPMEVDAQDITKYDEYAYGVEKEAITVDTRINSSNKGFSMLEKLGWVEGQPLGLSGEGRVDPIPFELKLDPTGLGKSSQDAAVIESTVSQRRELDSERQTRETEEQRIARENLVARQAVIKSEVSETLKAFYCAVCEKQFMKVAQYDEHCNSYSHHHKIRFRDQQAAQRAQSNSQEAIDKRREKERKREEKELRKVAKAAGVKIAVATPIVQPVQTTTSAEPASDAQQAFGSSAGGWKSITPSTGGFKKSGWTAIGSSSESQAPTPAVNEPPPQLAPEARSFSGFRSGGWTSLQSAPATHTPFRPVPDDSEPQGIAITGPVSSEDGLSSNNLVSGGQPVADPIRSGSPAPLPMATPKVGPARTGWQQFSAKGHKR